MGTTALNTRRPWWKQWRDRFWSTRFGTWLIVTFNSRIDPLLLRLSGGRLSLGGMIGLPILLLTTTGAKTGKQRSRAVMYMADRDYLVLIASRGGLPRHPSWYHNLKANPEVGVLLGSRSGNYLARDTNRDERVRLWPQLMHVYAGFDTYQQRASMREIPVIVLAPQTLT
jgi:deazaflavin-dependent oxidoreductase (nitroreductase family)